MGFPLICLEQAQDKCQILMAPWGQQRVCFQVRSGLFVVNTHLQWTNSQPDLGSCFLEVEATGLLALMCESDIK